MASAFPYLPTGTVYGTLLNFRREHALWAPRMHEAPYKAPPQAPVLYIKTSNTFTPSGREIVLPRGVAEVDVSPTLGLVAGEGGAVAGCALFNDVSIPHESYYRPAIRYRCVDGFLGVGPRVQPLADLAVLSGWQLTLRIDGVIRQTVALADLVRDAARLWQDVSAFQTMPPGDVLMLGTDCLPDGTRPRARAGNAVEVGVTGVPGFLPLVNAFVQEGNA